MSVMSRMIEENEAKLLAHERLRVFRLRERAAMPCYAVYAGYSTPCVDAGRLPLCPSCTAAYKLEGR